MQNTKIPVHFVMQLKENCTIWFGYFFVCVFYITKFFQLQAKVLILILSKSTFCQFWATRMQLSRWRRDQQFQLGLKEHYWVTEKNLAHFWYL